MKKIGTRPNQIPVNGMLGDMAFQDAEAVNITGGLLVGKPVETLVDQTALATKVDKAPGKQLSTEDYTTAEKGKLDGIATGATKNATDAQLRARSSHTGTQAISTVSGLAAELDARVEKTSDTGAAFLPVGTEAQRPTTPINGLLRYNNETNQFEGFQNGKWGSIGGGDALFSVEWWPKRSSVPAGYVPADGQLLSRSTYPDAAAGIDAGMMPVVTESEWDTDPLLRGSYTAGDGFLTFRLPDYNGASAGAFGPLFLRGGSSEGGMIQRDALQNLVGTIIVPGLGDASVSGVFGKIKRNDSSMILGSGPSAGFTLDASRVARTSDETRPLNVGGVWVVKLFGAVVNEGQADAAQLATDVASLQGQAANAYRPSNILGTVSQLDGVPTGALVEYGSNSNGEYWRYAGGMQIAVKREVINGTVNPGSGIPVNTAPSAQFVGHQNIHVSGGFWTGNGGTGSLLYTLMISGDGSYYMYNHGSAPSSVIFNYTPGSLPAASRAIKVLTVGRWY